MRSRPIRTTVRHVGGYLIEQVSGLPFEDYVETRILAPLGMSDSSFRQPLPPALAARLATGYRASLEPGAFEWDLAVPAGALSSTAADMARFMIAHLYGGRSGSTRILKAETVEAMQRRQFTNHPAVSGLTYGFQELNLAGQRVLAQPGDMLHFTAALFLLPEQDLALFVAYNRGRAAEAPMELLRAFVARFFPAPPAFFSYPTAISEGDVGRFAGSYRSTRRNETTLEKLVSFRQGCVAAADSPDRVGRLSGQGACAGTWPGRVGDAWGEPASKSWNSFPRHDLKQAAIAPGPVGSPRRRCALKPPGNSRASTAQGPPSPARRVFATRRGNRRRWPRRAPRCGSGS